MKKEFKQLVDFPKWEISEDGTVRSVESKKVKKPSYDAKGRTMIVLYRPSDGAAECHYLSELLHEYFGTPSEDIYNEGKLNEYRKALESYKNSENGDTVVKSSRSRTQIQHVESGKVFGGYSAAAKAFSFNYDKFYNTFYDGHKDTIIFEGQTFKKIS